MKESALQRDIIRNLLKAGWLPIRFNSGAAVMQGRYLSFYQVAGTLTRGIPDVIAFKGGQHLLLEVKSARGKQSDGQKAFEALSKKHGEVVYVVRSWHDVETIIGGMG